MLPPDIRHDTLDSYNFHDNGNDDLTSCLHLDISSTNCTPDTHVLLTLLTCSCSFPKSDNYLINHKMRQLTSVRGNLWISIYVRVYSGIRYVVQLKLSVRPEGLHVTEGSAGSLSSWYHPKRASYKTLLNASR